MRDFVVRRAPGHATLAARDGAPPGAPQIGAPRDAATVMLLRDGAAGVEVFVFRRVRAMAFAAGMLVFPGGAVDAQDADPSLRWVAEPPGQVSAPVAVAAVRETFEECGVLLAVPAGGGPEIPATTLAALDAARADLLAGRTTLAAVLNRHDLVLDGDLLHPWAHWITPVFEPRRYDTRFFAARVPPGQQPRDLGGEGEQAGWVSAAEALRRHHAGEQGMLPPTEVCLEDLVAAGTVDAVFAATRRLRPVMPWLAPRADGDSDQWVLRVHLDGVGGGDPGPDQCSPDRGTRP